jgi:hypothetical protein
MKPLDELETKVREIKSKIGSELSPEEMRTILLQAFPNLPANLIYNPGESYKIGQRVFHPSPRNGGWFIVARIIDDFTFVAAFKNSTPRHLLQNQNDSRNRHPYVATSSRNEEIHVPEGALNKACNTYRIQCFYHITHIDNLPGILRAGLLCHNLVRNYEDISDPDIQVHRHRKVIPQYPQFTLHDCVPLFFAPKSPMLSARREQQPQIVYLHLDPKVLLLDRVIFTNGNARSNATRFFSNLQDLDKLNWDILRTEYWSNDNPKQHEENKWARSAEVLVPGGIPAKYITMISVYDQKAYRRVEEMLKHAEMNLPVEIDPSLYFPIYSQAPEEGHPPRFHVSESLPPDYVPEPPPNFDDEDPFFIHSQSQP